MTDGHIAGVRLSNIYPSHSLMIEKDIPMIRERIRLFEHSLDCELSDDTIIDTDEIVCSTSKMIVVNDGESYYCVDGNCRLICLKIAAERIDLNPRVEVAAFRLDDDDLMQSLREQVGLTRSSQLCPIL
jgi:hypothetical protein